MWQASGTYIQVSQRAAVSHFSVVLWSPAELVRPHALMQPMVGSPTIAVSTNIFMGQLYSTLPYLRNRTVAPAVCMIAAVQ